MWNLQGLKKTGSTFAGSSGKAYGGTSCKWHLPCERDF